MENKKAILLILDGWGYGKNDSTDAVSSANTPFFDKLLNNYPNSKLQASGEAVGLPEGQMGNSEVGHMNLGAGRVVYQELGRINKAVKNHELSANPVLKTAFEFAKSNNKNVHFIGLLSDGGVHSHINHLKGLCDLAKEYQLKKVFIHAFMDGRDTDPNAGVSYLRELEKHLANSAGTVVSAIGRYYAMDRDNRWERVKLAYDLLVHGTGAASQDISENIQQSYEAGITDEFLAPIVKIDHDGLPVGRIENGDVVICFNFRTDRGREITSALTQKAYPEYDMEPLQLHYITLTTYDESFQNVQVVQKR